MDNWFDDGYHALHTGIISATLHLCVKDIRSMITAVEPVYDKDGDYQPEIVITIQNKKYKLTVDPYLG